MEGFAGSKEHVRVECVPTDKGQLGSSVLICLLLVFHTEWEMGVRLWRRAGCYVGRWERRMLLLRETIKQLRERHSE